jgi:H+/gluconate symporter-like permease
MWPFLVLAGCVMGFGLVTQQTASFGYLVEKIFSLQLNPYITALVSVAIVAGLCADGISAMMMWLGMFGAQYAAMPNVNPHALHRLLVCTTQTFDSLPHSQSTAISLSIFKLTHKEAYGGVFVTTVIIPTILVFSVLSAVLYFIKKT